MPDDKPKEPAASAPRAGGDSADQPYRTAAEVLGIKGPEGERDPRLSQSPNLQRIEGSEVPGYGDGRMVHHVMGPGQAPVDPIAAGLDMGYNPKVRHDLRAPSLTGEDGAGLRPSTYAEKVGGQDVQQASDGSHDLVKPPVPAAAAQPDKPAAQAASAPAVAPATVAPQPAAAAAAPTPAAKPAGS